MTALRAVPYVQYYSRLPGMPFAARPDRTKRPNWIIKCLGPTWPTMSQQCKTKLRGVDLTASVLLRTVPVSHCLALAVCFGLTTAFGTLDAAASQLKTSRRDVAAKMKAMLHHAERMSCLYLTLLRRLDCDVEPIPAVGTTEWIPWLAERPEQRLRICAPAKSYYIRTSVPPRTVVDIRHPKAAHQ